MDVPTIAARLGRPREEVVGDVQHLFGLLQVSTPLAAVVAGYELGILLPGRLKVAQ